MYNIILYSFMYSLICKSMFLYSWRTDGKKHNSLTFVRKTLINLPGAVQTPKLLNEQPVVENNLFCKEKKKDAEDMAEPKVHTADSPHMAYSKLFPAEDGEGVRFFFFAGGDC